MAGYWVLAIDDLSKCDENKHPFACGHHIHKILNNLKNICRYGNDNLRYNCCCNFSVNIIETYHDHSYHYSPYFDIENHDKFQFNLPWSSVRLPVSLQVIKLLMEYIGKEVFVQ